jgi:hypothetical protein
VTNYEWIINMRIEEMAQFMFDMVDCVYCANKRQRPDAKCQGDGTRVIHLEFKEPKTTIKESE